MRQRGNPHIRSAHICGGASQGAGRRRAAGRGRSCGDEAARKTGGRVINRQVLPEVSGRAGSLQLRAVRWAAAPSAAGGGGRSHAMRCDSMHARARAALWRGGADRITITSTRYYLYSIRSKLL
eukprot:SAG31_NODE_1462_length_8242_cov_5.541135_2_plen_124_part_00